MVVIMVRRVVRRRAAMRRMVGPLQIKIETMEG
jgi:hypothetical protein